MSGVRRRPWARVLALVLLLAGSASASAQEIGGARYLEGLAAFDEGRYAKAFEIWKTLEREGDPLAAYSLGGLYETGRAPGGRDFERALALFEGAAASGVPDAQNKLGLLLAQGRQVARDMPRAIELWKTAARAEHPEAMFNLGLAIMRGDGVERDEKKGALFMLSAADLGNVDAAFAVAEMYRLGLILRHDPSFALAWYREAAAAGHAKAARHARLLEELGVEPPPEDAKGMPRDESGQ